MRALAILALLLPALGSLAIIPPAAATPSEAAPVCLWQEVEAGPVKAGVDQCRESHEADTCSNGSPQRIHHYRQVGPVYGQVHLCLPHSPPPDLLAAGSGPAEAAMADPFPTCVTEPCGPGTPDVDSCDLQAATPTSVGPTGLDLQRLVWGYDTSQCDVDVEPIGACAPPSGRTIERRVAFVHVTLLLCGGGIGDGWS